MANKTRWIKCILKNLSLVWKKLKIFKFSEKRCVIIIGIDFCHYLVKLTKIDHLENFAFEKLDFGLSFYVSCVDDLFVSIPLINLWIFIYVFNSFHPKPKFAYEIEKKSVFRQKIN